MHQAQMLQDSLRVYRIFKHIVFVKNVYRSLVTEHGEYDTPRDEDDICHMLQRQRQR